MAKTLNIQVKGVRKTLATLILGNKLIEIATTEGIAEGTKILKTEVEESIEGHKSEPRSIDTGEFRKSIKSEAIKNTGRIFTEVEHSIFLEKGTTRIPARHHFGNSLNRKRIEIVDIIGNEIKKVI